MVFKALLISLQIFLSNRGKKELKWKLLRVIKFSFIIKRVHIAMERVCIGSIFQKISWNKGVNSEKTKVFFDGTMNVKIIASCGVLHNFVLQDIKFRFSGYEAHN